jgi:hypothetical protein
VEDSADDNDDAFPREEYTCLIVWFTGDGSSSGVRVCPKIRVAGDGFVGILCNLALNKTIERFTGGIKTIGGCKSRKRRVTR